MKRILKLAALAALGMALAQGAAAKGNAAAGKEKAAAVCAACHGVDGNKPSAADQPIIAGQYYDYLVQALKEYKSGKRNNAIMKGFAATLSVKDMEDLAAWFSSQESGLHTER